MVHCVGSVSVVIIVVIGIVVVYHDCITMIPSVITMVVIVMIVTINPNCYDRKRSKIGWINSIVIRGIVGNVNR